MEKFKRHWPESEVRAMIREEINTTLMTITGERVRALVREELAHTPIRAEVRRSVWARVLQWLRVS